MTGEFDDIVAAIKEEREHRMPIYGSLPESIFKEDERMSRSRIMASTEDREVSLRNAIDNFFAEIEKNND